MASNFWKRRLGRELAILREAAGLRQEDAGATVDRTQPRIAQIEKGTGKGVIDLAVVRALAGVYGATPAALDRLVKLWENAKRNGWWSIYGLPDWLADYMSLEADATRLREFQLELVPGLLQTVDYTRALHRLRGTFTEQEVQRRVDIRMQRQERVVSGEMAVSLVVSEAALLRCRGCGEMGAAQLRQLRERASWPNVDLGVLPFGAGLHGNMTGTFTVLELPAGLMPSMVYQEYPVGGHLIEEESVVEQMLTLFSELRRQALGADDSLALIAELC